MPRKSKVKGEDTMISKQAPKRASPSPLKEYDATTLVGLRTVVHGAAIERIDEKGEVSVELPKLPELMATAAVIRCLVPIRLRGTEIKAMRKIMGLTLSELAKRLDERTATETISRWESEAQPMGGFAEKLLRLLVCEELCKDAPGVNYNASMIANLKVADPWRPDPEYQLPALHLELMKMNDQSGSIIETWDGKMAA
jgi:DNA-binding transcriptional regulator YiaG